MEQVQILSVVCDGIEYRCEQRKVQASDYNRDYTESKRSKWLSREGEEIDDNTAMAVYKEQTEKQARNELLNRLWRR